ncbi:MAG TPA: IS21-like element helper ATPase IstB [Bacteroidales bacterium]|nr:IS21-like element helper ATPase IstB [Bacteroidales bacterium]
MINTDQTLEKLQQLKLFGMAQAYETTLTLPSHELPTSHELMARLVEAEQLNRIQQRTQMYLKLSGLRYDALLEQIKCSSERNLTRDQILALADCTFIQRAENILITGSTGCGKSYLACAFGRQACTLGYKTLYLGMNRFTEKLALSKLDGSYIKLLNQIEKIPLIILDDFGLVPLENHARTALLQLLEDRYGKRSTIITSQLPVAKWYQYINEPTLADAIMDRLSGSAHRFELKGESLRRKKTEKN